jgi:hypothetical protein
MTDIQVERRRTLLGVLTLVDVITLVLVGRMYVSGSGRR